MKKLVRVGGVIRSEARTIERQGVELEVLDTIQVAVSAWKTSGGSQRWVGIRIVTGPREGLELFVPLDTFERGNSILPGIHVGEVITE